MAATFTNARDDAAFFRRLAATKYGPGHHNHRGCLATAQRLDEIAAEAEFSNTDLSLDAITRPTAGDALALRGEVP